MQPQQERNDSYSAEADPKTRQYQGFMMLENLTKDGMGGQERGEKEFEALFRAAGFRLSRIVVTRAPVCVVEVYRSANRP